MILATKTGDRFATSSMDSLVAMELNAGGGRLTQGMIPFTGKDMGGLPAASVAIRLTAWAVAKRELGVWRGLGVGKQKVTGSWQARFFAGQPNERDSWFLLMEATEASLTSRNNAYWLKIKDAGQVSAVYVQHPDQVQARWNRTTGKPEYRCQLQDGSGSWGDWMGPDEILHFRVGYPYPGAIVAPTPIELHKLSLGASVAKFRSEEAFHREGLARGVAVTFPKEIKPEQARAYREMMAQEVGGASNTGKTRVFGGGATVTTIGLTLADAEFVLAKHMSARETLQILGLPATLADAGDPAQKPLTPEHEEARFNTYFVEPRLARIQEAIRSDPDFFGVATKTYPAFGDVRVRADTQTESNVLVSEVQAGIRLPDEARAERGLPPLPNGLGQIPQITPVGGAPNPAAGDPYAPTGDE